MSSPFFYTFLITEHMTIHFSNDRPGYTYLPDAVDEATGERVEGTGMLAESHIANLVKDDQLNFEGQDPTSYEEVSPLTEQEQIDADPDYQPEDISPVELASISDEIHSASVSPDEALASSIASLDMGNKAADIAVQYFAHKVYDGQMTPTEAFEEAVNSGLPPEALAASFRKLQSHFK